MTQDHTNNNAANQQQASRPWRPPTSRMTIPIFATPISNHLWSDSDALNASLADAITQREQYDSGIARSNVGGWHSDTDLFDWDNEHIAALQRRLRSYVDELFRSVMLENTALSDRHYRIEGWANVLRYGQYHSVHNHPNAFWSGVYFITGNPDARPDHPFSGKLELLDPRPGASLTYSEGSSLYGRFLINPQPGQMVIFPGWLQHQVHPYFGDGERTTIAFNVIPTW